MTTLANGLASINYNVDFVLVTRSGTNLRRLSPAIRVVDLQRRRTAVSLFSFINYLKQEGPDVIISAQNYVNVIAVLGNLLSGRRVPIILTEHGTLSQSVRRAGWFSRWPIVAAMRYIYPMADRIVAVSRGARMDLIRVLGISPDLVQTIYNPVEVSQPDDEPVPLENFRPAAELVLAVGHLRPEKDYGTLLRAFSKVRRQRNCYLMVLGEGQCRTELERLKDRLGLASDVYFLGYSDVPYRWMRAADVFVLSSAWEGLPTALIEAMACGARVVSTDCASGPAEILEDGRWGRIVPVGDADALAAAIEAALDDEHPPNVKARAKDFSVARAVEQYASLVNSLL